MEENFKKYSLLIMVFCISFISIGTSLFLLNGGKLGLLKKRLGASIVNVNSVPSGSTITDTEFYAELVDSYNAEKGTSYGYDHVFTTAELASLKTLVIDENGSHYHGNPVQDLSGLTYLTGLETLVLHANQITEVNLSSNTGLKNLDLNIPNLSVLNLFENNSLQSVNTTKPTNPGTIIVRKGHDYSYLFGSSSSQVDSVTDDSFAISCDKYNLAVGETANCTIKGKITEAMNTVMFKLVQNNSNVTMSQLQKDSIFSGDKNVVYLSNNMPIGEEFNIATFTVTGVTPGTTKLSFTDYDGENPIGYVRNRDWELSYNTASETTFYVDKYVMKDASGNTVSSGKLKTNYVLNIVGDNGQYNPAFDIAVLGDVKADGIVNGQDVGKAYITSGTSVKDLTTAEKKALDYNFDGYYNLLDVWQIYNNNIN